MKSLISGLKEDHQYMTRLLHRLQSQIQAVQGGSNMEPVLQIVDYLKQYPDLWHHPIEEQMFELLLQKPLTEHEKALVEKIVDEHALLDALAELLDIKISQYLHGNANKAALIRTTNKLVFQQLRHIEYEQNHLFALCEKYLDEADWQSLVSISDSVRWQNQEMPFYHKLREVIARIHH